MGNTGNNFGPLRPPPPPPAATASPISPNQVRSQALHEKASFEAELSELVTALQGGEEVEKTAALEKLLAFSAVKENRVHMGSARAGLNPLLCDFIRTTAIEGGHAHLIALKILGELSAAAVNQARMVSASVGLLDALKTSIQCNTGDVQLAALQVLRNLSAAPENRVPLASLDLGLLQFLTVVIEYGDAARVSTLDVLCNLSLADENKAMMASRSIGLLPKLVKIMSDDDHKAMELALCIVSRMSLASETHVLLVATGGIVQLLKKLAAEVGNHAEAAAAILDVLSHSIQDVRSVAAEVLSNYGVELDLLGACVKYQLYLCDARVETESERGLAGLKGFKLAMQSKGKIERQFPFSAILFAMLPDEFLFLGTLRQQAQWIKRRMDVQANALMATYELNKHLPAFERFLLSLPQDLQCEKPAHTLVESHATITCDVELNANGCAIVDGMFCDVPIITPVKIKLRSVEHNGTVEHEHKMLVKFHKHFPCFVVTPFALVSTSDSTLHMNGYSCGDYLGIVLERGAESMDQFLTTPQAKEPISQTDMLVGVVNIVKAAHSCEIVLLDLQPAHLVSFCNRFRDGGTWKAIGFDKSRHFGEEVAKAATPEYASYEMARHVLDGDCGAKLKAVPAMDICSLGWVVWVIFNNGVSLWDQLGLTTKNTNSWICADEQERMILEKLANMTQPELLQHINATFADDTSVHSALRRFLPKLLHVDPHLRLSADQLQEAAPSLLDISSNPNILTSILSVCGKVDDLSSQLTDHCAAQNSFNVETANNTQKLHHEFLNCIDNIMMRSLWSPAVRDGLETSDMPMTTKLNEMTTMLFAMKQQLTGALANQSTTLVRMEDTIDVRSTWSRLSTELDVGVFGRSLVNNNSGDVARELGVIVGMLKQQSDDAKDNKVSIETIAVAMKSLPADISHSLMPSISAIMAEADDQNGKLNVVLEMLMSMQLQLDDVLSMQRTQLSILKYLQEFDYNFPHSFIIVPKRPAQPFQLRRFKDRLCDAYKTVAKALADMLFNTMYLFFFCPVTGKLVPCGKDGHGYVLSSLKKWVKQLIPIIKMGLLAAKVALATQGFGGFVPNLFPNEEIQDQLSDMLADATNAVELGSEAIESQETTNILEAGIVGSLKNELLDGIVVAVAGEEMQNLTDTKSYRPKKCGLEHVAYTDPDGSVTYAWVSAEGRGAFERDGTAAFTNKNK